jgi:hypothetical protein
MDGAAVCEPLESRTLLATTPIVRISVNDPTAAEFPRDIGEFTIRRTGSIDAPLTVRYLLSAPVEGPSGPQNGVGKNGVDFTPLDAQVTIPAGRRSTTLPIIPIDDLTVEGDEIVMVTLLDDAAYDIDEPGPTRSATLTITDDDLLPMVTLHRPDMRAAEVGQDTARFIIMRSGPRNLPLTVQLTVGGSATPGVDYEPLPASVTIRPGRGQVALYVRPYNDGLFEGNESVRVTLNPDSRFSLNQSDGSQVSTYAIIRDRPTVTITVADPVATTDPSDTGTFRITRTGSTTDALRVSYFLGGTATVGTDFVRLPEVITIPAGRSSVLVTIRGRGTQFDTPYKNVNMLLKRLPTYNLDHTDPGSNLRQIRIWDDRQGTPG